MGAHRLVVGRPRAHRLAVGGLRLSLAVVFVALGCGFLILPRLAAELGQAGYGPISRLVFGVSHLAVGLTLLIPRLAGATFALGSLVIWSTVRCLPWGEAILPIGPSMLSISLLVLAVWCRSRRRADISAWYAALDRYAQREMRPPGASQP